MLPTGRPDGTYQLPTPTSASISPSQVTPSLCGVAVVLGDLVRVHAGVELAVLHVRHDLFAEQTSALGAALEVRAVRREVTGAANGYVGIGVDAQCPCHDPLAGLTPTADTDKHEQRRSTLNLNGLSVEALHGVCDISSSRDLPDKDAGRSQSLCAAVPHPCPLGRELTENRGHQQGSRTAKAPDLRCWSGTFNLRSGWGI